MTFVTSPSLIDKSKLKTSLMTQRRIKGKKIKSLIPKAVDAIVDAVTVANQTRSPLGNIVFKVEVNNNKQKRDSSNNDSGDKTPPPKKKRRKQYHDPNNSPGSHRPYEKREPNSLKFNSGLNTTPLYPETLRQGDSSSSPIFIQCGSILSKRSIDAYDNKVINYLDTNFDQVYNKISQLKGPNIARNLDKDEYLSYLFDVKEALEAVFTLRSILTYQENNPEYLNYGIQKLQERFSPTIRGDLSDLEAALEIHYFPDNFLNFLRYIYSNFRSSDCDSSPIIRLCHERLFYTSSIEGVCLDGCMESDVLRKLLSNLTDPTIDWKGNVITNVFASKERIRTRSLLVSAFPERIINKNIFNVSGSAIYDNSFLCFWQNSPITFIDPFSTNGSSKVIHSREVKEKGEYIRYEVVCSLKEVDGYALGLQNLNFNGIFGPGIWNPLLDFSGIDDITNHTNMLRMKGIYLEANMPVELASQSGVQYQPVIEGDQITIGSYFNFGSMLLEGLSIYTAEEFSVKLLAYLMN